MSNQPSFGEMSDEDRIRQHLARQHYPKGAVDYVLAQYHRALRNGENIWSPPRWADKVVQDWVSNPLAAARHVYCGTCVNGWILNDADEATRCGCVGAKS